MTTLLEAAKQALEALEVSTDWDVNATGKQAQSMRAITAIREALAQPEQEPVAWMYESTCGQDFATPFEPPIYAKNVRPLYTRPHSQAICEDYSQAAAIKEALAQQQEPVAWYDPEVMNEDRGISWTPGQFHTAPLFTAPPAKPWVSPNIKEYEDIMLANITPRTNDERDGIMGALSDMVVLLKEKNT